MPINIPQFGTPQISEDKQHPVYFIKKPTASKRKFTPEEDKLLVVLVGNERYPNWSQIASHIEGKNARQCREHYAHYLAPHVSNDPWTEAEDELLLEKYQIYGTDWAKICTFFKGRTNTAVKNRYNVHIIKKLNTINSESLQNPFKVQPAESINTDFTFDHYDIYQPENSPQPVNSPQTQNSPQLANSPQTQTFSQAENNQSEFDKEEDEEIIDDFGFLSFDSNDCFNGTSSMGVVEGSSDEMDFFTFF
ncbi:Myb-like DNA-binding domain containing protein [Tritrichomonas foetus]|uniref:Myb-like DNA-binding domain containing protein n=1 Tax=Tritrichomonas foetus TaxID=1144522 RepID=A0A1J4JG84_9EUKA|nr:Myb-like DNA-binding domain containing protein [Tritrichomonas foetus]|eukprot:OHS98198.1 Myb-like DNA-binding domain containing protein [Tritrichomonas foetus]